MLFNFEDAKRIKQIRKIDQNSKCPLQTDRLLVIPESFLQGDANQYAATANS